MENEVTDFSELSGYFRVKKKVFWARRFIVFRSGLLYYYKSPTSTTPRGIFHLFGKKIYRDARELVVDIVKEGSDPIKIKFYTKTEFELWFQCLSLATAESKQNTQVCAYEEMIKVTNIENKKLVEQIPQASMKTILKHKIDEIKSRQYQLVGSKGPSLFSCTSQKTEQVQRKEKLNSKTYLALAFIIFEVVEWMFGHIMTICAILAVFGYFYADDKMVKDSQVSENKVYFKNSVLLRAGVGEILTALYDTISRTSWDPYLVDVVEGSEIRLTYHFHSVTVNQSISRELVREGSSFYLVEKTGMDVKNLFLIESKDKKGQLLTLITHFGAIDSKSSPLVGNPELLSCLKIFVEANTVYVNTNQIILTEKLSDEEDQPELIAELDQNASYIEEARKACNLAEDTLNAREGWEPLKLSGSAKGYRKKLNSDFYVVRSEIEINRTPEEILLVLQDLSRKGAYDSSFESGHVIEKISESAEIVYQKYKGKLGVSARDFALIHTKFDGPNGKISAVATSIIHPKCPETKFVRGHLYFGCHFLTPTGSNSTLDTYMIYVDIRGSVPKFLANTVQSEQAMVVENLRNFVN